MSGYQPLDVQPKAVGMVNSQPTLETVSVKWVNCADTFID